MENWNVNLWQAVYFFVLALWLTRLGCNHHFGPKTSDIGSHGGNQLLIHPKDGNAKSPMVGFPASDPPSFNEPALQGQVEKLNRQNTEHSHGKAETGNQTSDSRSGARIQEQAAELIPDGPHASSTVQSADKEPTETEEEDGDIFEDSESEEETQDGKVVDDVKQKDKDDVKEASKSGTSQSVASEVCPTSSLPVERYFLFLILIHRGCWYSKQCWKNSDRWSVIIKWVFFALRQPPPTFQSNDEVEDVAACSKRRVASEEELLKDDLKKSRVEESDAEKTDGKSVEESESRVPESEEVKVEAEETAADSAVKEFTIGETRPQKQTC